MRFFWLALALALGACEATIPEGRYACLSDEDCPEDLVCRVSIERCYYTLDGGD